MIPLINNDSIYIYTHVTYIYIHVTHIYIYIYYPYVCKSLGHGSHRKKCFFNHLVGLNDVTCIQGLYPSSEPPNFLFGGPLGGGSLRLFKMATDGWKLVQDWNLRVFAMVLLLILLSRNRIIESDCFLFHVFCVFLQ